jgi:hypothetical protein
VSVSEVRQTDWRLTVSRSRINDDELISVLIASLSLYVPFSTLKEVVTGPRSQRGFLTVQPLNVHLAVCIKLTIYRQPRVISLSILYYYFTVYCFRKAQVSNIDAEGSSWAPHNCQENSKLASSSIQRNYVPQFDALRTMQQMTCH